MHSLRLGVPRAALIALLLGAVSGAPALAVPPHLLPPVANATGGGPTIAVITVGLDARARTQLGVLEQGAEDALVQSGRFRLMPAADVFDPTAAAERARAGSDALARVKEGQKAIDDLDTQKATESFAVALALLHKADLVRGFKDFVDTWVLKAAGHASGGELAQAKRELDALVAVAPRAELSGQYFSPELLKYAEQQRKTASNARAELTVRTEPPGARVWVDGVARGPSPVTVANVMAGKHVVIASLGGYAMSVEELSAGENLIKLKPAELSTSLTRAVDLVSKDSLGPTRDAIIKTLGQKLDVEQVLLLVAKKDTTGERLELIVERLDTKDGHNAAWATRTVPMGDPSAIAALLEPLLTRDEPRSGSSPVTHFIGGGGSGGRKIAGYALLGAGLAMVGTGVVCGLQAQDKAAEYRATAQTRTVIANNIAGTGRTFSIIADVSFVAGGASLIAGSVLAFFGGAPAQPEFEDTAKSKAPPKKKKESEPSKRKDDSKKPADPKKDTKRDDEKAADLKRKDDERRKAEDDKRRADDEKAAAEQKKADEDRAEQKRRDDERAAEQKKTETSKKKTKKELQEEEKRKKEDEKRKADEDRKDEERRKADDEKRKADESRAREEEKKKKEKKDEDDLKNF